LHQGQNSRGIKEKEKRFLQIGPWIIRAYSNKIICPLLIINIVS
jgi:hypothetical protein